MMATVETPQGVAVKVPFLDDDCSKLWQPLLDKDASRIDKPCLLTAVHIYDGKSWSGTFGKLKAVAVELAVSFASSNPRDYDVERLRFRHSITGDTSLDRQQKDAKLLAFESANSARYVVYS